MTHGRGRGSEHVPYDPRVSTTKLGNKKLSKFGGFRNNEKEGLAIYITLNEHKWHMGVDSL